MLDPNQYAVISGSEMLAMDIGACKIDAEFAEVDITDCNLQYQADSAV